MVQSHASPSLKWLEGFRWLALGGGLIGGLVVAAVGVFVFPRFAGHLSDQNAAMPWLMRAACHVPAPAWIVLGLGPFGAMVFGRVLRVSRPRALVIDAVAVVAIITITVWLILAMWLGYVSIIRSAGTL